MKKIISLQGFINSQYSKAKSPEADFLSKAVLMLLALSKTKEVSQYNYLLI
jgi:hypothetical protein